MSKQVHCLYNNILVSLNLKMRSMDGIKSIGMMCDVNLRE